MARGSTSNGGYQASLQTSAGTGPITPQQPQQQTPNAAGGQQLPVGGTSTGGSDLFSMLFPSYFASSAHVPMTGTNTPAPSPVSYSGAPGRVPIMQPPAGTAPVPMNGNPDQVPIPQPPPNSFSLNNWIAY